MSDVPMVTVLIPARNEERDIESCLRGVLAQDHPHERMEVVLVDGGSTDRTVRQAARCLGTGGIRWTIVDNPAGTTPSNLNAGLATAVGEVVCRVDARSVVPPHYVRTCAEILASDEIVVAGGRQVARSREGADLVARSIVRGLNNRWATGLARYRRGARSGPTDTVYLGAMRSADLRRVGGWDVRFETNQDFDLNRRLAAHGKVWFDDRLVVGYLPRESFGALWRQHVRFGRWKVRYWRTRGQRPEPRQYGLLAGPVVAAGLALALFRRHPRTATAAAVAGAVALDATGSEEPAPFPVRVGGLAASAIVATGWWFGVVTGWARGGASMKQPCLIIVSRSIPPDPGGYQRQMALLAPYLRQGFSRLTWIGALRSPQSSLPSPIEGVDRLVRVPADRLPQRMQGVASPTVVLCGLVLALWAALRQHRPRVLLLSPGLPGAPTAVRVLSRLNVHVVARYPTTGDLTERRGRAVGRTRGVRAVAPSPLQTREQSEFPVALVPNAVAMHGGAAGKEEEDDSTRFPRRFVYVGRLIRRKRADLLLDAWRVASGDLPGWELVLVGDGGYEEDSIEHELRAEVDQGQIHRVVLAGAVDDPSALLRPGDVFVFPSVREGQPNAVLEAYAAGLSVIAARDRMVEWFEPTPPLLAWSGEPDDLAEAMRSAARRSDLVELGAAGRAFVREHHPPERSASLMAAVLGVE